MAKWWWFYIALFVNSAIIAYTILAFHPSKGTDKSDVQGLQSFYKSVNRPLQLKNWKLEGGDPCKESWKGVQCVGSSVVRLELQGLGLTGILGIKLEMLRSLKHLDLSSNNIGGSISYSLPHRGHNLTYINLASNNLSGNFPYTFSFLKHLQYLNLSHNSLSGTLGDQFVHLNNLREVDLSFNNFTGNLHPAVTYLTNLTCLSLENNNINGSVAYLSNLPLTDLNIKDNKFEGVIPEEFQAIHKLRIEGNEFDIGGNSSSLDHDIVMPTEQNVSSPSPGTNFSGVESPQIVGVHNMKRTLHVAKIFISVFGVNLFTAYAALVVVPSSWKKLKSSWITESSIQVGFYIHSQIQKYAAIPTSSSRWSKILMASTIIIIIIIIAGNYDYYVGENDNSSNESDDNYEFRMNYWLSCMRGTIDDGHIYPCGYSYENLMEDRRVHGKIDLAYEEALKVFHNHNQSLVDLDICWLDFKRCPKKTLEFMRYMDSLMDW